MRTRYSASPADSLDKLAGMTRMRRPGFLAVAMIASALVLTGCVPSPPDRGAVDENFQEPQAPQAPPELVPDGNAEDNLPFFQETLRQFSAGTAEVQGEPIVNHLAAAGFDKGKMQVSFDRSKTDLVADSIYVSVRFDDQCLVGQVVHEDRSVVGLVEPALGPNTDICLIGTTRPIDW